LFYLGPKVLEGEFFPPKSTKRKRKKRRKKKNKKPEKEMMPFKVLQKRY